MNIACFSHLRWDFVFQRPQHLLSRAARAWHVLYVEEPIEGDGDVCCELRTDASGVQIAVPRIPRGLSADAQCAALADAVTPIVGHQSHGPLALWYYTPMALPFTNHLTADAVIYDCMDELSAFAGAPAELQTLEARLFAKADVVFTGGRRLYEAKRRLHANVHCFPSSVDVDHFRRARGVTAEPDDQAAIRGVRLGYFGVIDERMDYELIRAVAAAKPEWQIILIGPMAKIDPARLPVAPNIHYLGAKPYARLPEYIAGWDVALLPFARNAATRFISPTKTPEYLAAGKPVVATSIEDVVRPYGEQRLARIADTPSDFVAAVAAALAEDAAVRTREADAFLAPMSWDRTWAEMRALVEQAVDSRRGAGGTRAILRRRFAAGGESRV